MPKTTIAREPERLTGYFQGKKASDDEERFCTRYARRKDVLRMWFRFVLGSKATNNWLELDVLAKTTDGWRALEIDDMEFVHRGEMERSEAVLKDIRRMNMLRELGVYPFKGKIEHIDAAKLKDPESADRAVRNFARD